MHTAVTMLTMPVASSQGARRTLFSPLRAPAFRAPRGARGLRLAAAASNDKPLKSLVENEDTRSTVAIGAIFGVTLATCGLLLFNALDSRVVNSETKGVAPQDVGIAPIVSSKPALPEKEQQFKNAAPAAAPVAKAPQTPPPAPKAAPTPAPAAAPTRATPPPRAATDGPADTNQVGTLALSVGVLGVLGGAAVYAQQQGLLADGAASGGSAAGGVASSKAEAQAWISAWRVRTGVDAAVRKREAQAWIAAWRARTK